LSTHVVERGRVAVRGAITALPAASCAPLSTAAKLANSDVERKIVS